MIVAVRAGAMFMVAGAVRARRARLLPAWFHRLTLATGFVLIIWATYYKPVAALIPLWVPAVSVFILRRIPNAVSPIEA